MGRDDQLVSRRSFLALSSGVAVTGPARASPGQPNNTTNGAATGTPSENGTTNETPQPQSPTPGGRTHTVDMNDDAEFVPDELTIAPGDTVVWENVGTVLHSVTAYEDNIPDEAAFISSGGYESEEAARENNASGDIAGRESFEHTFEVLGSYEYFCLPHEPVGMIGSIEVVEGGDGGDSAEAAGPRVPENAKMLGIGISAAMVATIGLALAFDKYGGHLEDEE